MNKLNLLDGLFANDVKVNKRFERICTSHNPDCISEYRPLFQKVLDGMSNILVEAFNSRSGLTSGVRKSLKKLSNLLVVISAKTTASGYEKLEAKVDAEISKHENSVESNNLNNEEGHLSMKNEILKQVSVYRQGIEVMISAGMLADRADILNDCISKLNDLEEELDNIIDITSTDALKHAKAVQSKLREFGDTIAISMHSKSTPAVVDHVIAEVKQWAKIREVKKGFFGSKKPADISELYFDEKEDKLAHVVNSRRYLEDINNFKSNLAHFKEMVERQSSTAEETEKLNKLLEEKKQLENQAVNLGNEFNNGIISKNDLANRLDEMEREQDRNAERIERLQDKISERKDNYDAQERVIFSLDSLLEVIEEYADTDPEVISLLGEEIDFNALTNLMRGNADVEDEQSVRALDELTELVGRKKREGARAFAEKMKEKHKKRREEKNAEREAERAARRADNAEQQETNREDLLNRLARLSGQPSRVQPQPQGQQDSQQNTEDPIKNPVGGFQA